MKNNKIIVIVSSDANRRMEYLSRLMVAKGFAAIPSDARKIIKPGIEDVDPNKAYFVAVGTYDFTGAVHTTQRLYELSARGLFVAVGTKKLPREYEIISEVYYVDDYQ